MRVNEGVAGEVQGAGRFEVGGVAVRVVPVTLGGGRLTAGVLFPVVPPVPSVPEVVMARVENSPSAEVVILPAASSEITR